MNEQNYPATSQLAPRIYEYVLAGLLLAVSAGGVVGYHVYHGFITEEIARDRAYWGIGLPFIGVVAGVYIYAYGWQRGDVEKAIRMSMWLSLGVLGIIAAVLGTLSLKRSARFGGIGLGFPGFGRSSYRRRPRSGWYAGSGYDDYNDDPPLFGGSIFGGDRDEASGRAGSIEIHCVRCGEMFVPQAPGGYCPRCGHSAIGKTG